MGKSQIYWLGPGVYGSKAQKNLLIPGNPIPDNWSKENFKRFKNKIGEKLEKGVLQDVKSLKEEIKTLKAEIQAITAERDGLFEELEGRNKEGDE